MPTRKGVTSAQLGDGLGDTITLPGSPAEGDLVLVYIGNDAVNPGVVTAGYTVVSNETGDASLPQLRIERKFMGATPDAEVEVGAATSPQQRPTPVIVEVWSGVDPATPIGTPATANGASGLPNPPGLTTAADASVRIIAGVADDIEVTDFTAPSGFGGLAQETTPGAVSGEASSLAVASRAEATAGALDPDAFGGTGSDGWRAIHFELFAVEDPARDIDADQAVAAFDQAAVLALTVAAAAAQVLPAFVQAAQLNAFAVRTMTAAQAAPSFGQAVAAAVRVAVSGAQVVPAPAPAAVLDSTVAAAAVQVLPAFGQAASLGWVVPVAPRPVPHALILRIHAFH